MWIILLILFVWPLALFLAVIYVLMLPLKACCGPCAGVIDALHDGVLLPFTVAKYAVEGRPFC